MMKKTMTALKIAATQDPRKLSQAVIQIIDSLHMFQAELARILKLQCADIGLLSSGQNCLQPDTIAWQQALLFVRLYQALYKKFEGDRVAMIHWLRAEHKSFDLSPHLLIVDENRLNEIVLFLENSMEDKYE